VSRIRRLVHKKPPPPAGRVKAVSNSCTN
jgi:hypothetical protein